MSFAFTYNKLTQPSPNIVPFVEQLNRQVYYFLQTAPAESRFSFPTEFGTLTASRRNSKVFIVGFIPPDNAVNFVPVRRVGTPMGDIPGGPSASGPTTAPGNVNSNSYLPDPKGNQPLTTRPVRPEDLRQALIDSFYKVTGQVIDPATLCMMFGQKALENGYYGKGKSQDSPNGYLFTKNYNLGSSHAGGSAGSFNKGPDGRRVASAGVERAATPPSTGTFFLGTDTHANGDKYPVYFHSFDSLQDASDYSVALLLEKWPNIATATTPEEYNNALLPSLGKGQPKVVGRDYHVAGDVYRRSIDIQCNKYKQLGFDQLPIEPTGAQAVASVSDEAVQEERSLMSYDGFTGFERDPIGDRIGRNLEVDDRRQAIVDRQTEALRRQIDIIKATPPLVMLINPSSFRRTYEQATDSGVKTRSRNVVHAWLERPMKISCNGVTAGQYAFDFEGNGGLTNTNRVHSLSYGNLLSLVTIYKNNGIILSGEEVGQEAGVPIIPFTIFIYYDDRIYLGSFDDFTVEDSGDKPYNMSYSCNFTVRYDQQLDQRLVDSSVASGLGF